MIEQLPTPQVRARVRLYETSKGGRKGPTAEGKAFGCLFVINDENFDCRMLPIGKRAFTPGEQTDAHIQFLNPQMILELLTPGAKFHVRDGAIVGEGEVLEILKPKK